jgi:hypothetical protein
MHIVKVVYTAKPGYVEQNQSNIKNVMKELREANTGILYHVCLGDDGKTFTHTAFSESAEHNKVLLALPAFKHFQEQLKANGIEVPPKQEHLTLVDSSRNLF